MNNSKLSPHSQTVLIQPSVKREAQRLLAERYFHAFVRQAWHVVEPGVPFVDGWHIAGECENLQALAEGRLASQNLLMNVPPGTMKTIISSICFQPWVWIKWPASRWMSSSYDQRMAYDASTKTRLLIQSDWYQSNWGHLFKLRDDQNQKSYFGNNHSGWRLAVPTGTGTGWHPDFLIVDDPHNVKEAESEAEREACIHWWSGTMSTRGVSRGVRRVLIMQRLHDEDLSGHVLKTGGWEHICLPMRFEPDRMQPTSIGWTDPRTEPGELLWPGLFDEKKVSDTEHAISMMGEGRVAGQLQQRPPSHYEGAEWPADYFREEHIYFDEWPDDGRFALKVCYCDPSLGKDKKTADYSAIVSIGLDEHGTMWVKCSMERRDSAKIVEDSHDIYDWFKPQAFGFESDCWQVLLARDVERESKRRGMTMPVWDIPTGRINKEVRIRRLTPFLKRGEFKIFKDKGGELLLRQLKAFPGGTHDDGPDALEGGVRLLQHLFTNEANTGATMQVAVA